MIKIAFNVVFALGMSSSLQAVSANSTDVIQQHLQEHVEALQIQEKIVGLGAVVIQNDEVKALAVSGERKINSGVSILADDQWHLGSITKSITATTLAVLVESGQLGWDTPLKDYFADEELDSSWVSVTLSDLLTHTSGARENFARNIPATSLTDVGEKLSRERQRAVLAVLAKPTKSAIGKYVYSNVGYTIAGVIAERETGRSWESLVRELVFTPLHLNRSGFGNPDFQGRTLAQPRGHRSILGLRRSAGQDDDNNPIIGPAGIVHMTLTDLAVFANDHLQGSRGEGALLTAETYRLLHTPDKDNYAYGWSVFERRNWARGKVIWHNGSNRMWYAIVAILVDLNAVMAVVSNDGRMKMVEKAAVEIFDKAAGQLQRKQN